MDSESHPQSHSEERLHPVHSLGPLRAIRMEITSVRGMARKKATVESTFLLTYLSLGKIILSMGRKKNPHAEALGALGGKARAENLSGAQLAEIGSKGGKARAERLSAARRREIAELAVAARERKRSQQQRKGKH